MIILLTVIHVLVCFTLIAVILLQAGRGQGLTGAAFGSGNVQSLFGTRAADFLSKATSVTAILFLFTCIGLDLYEAQKSRSLLELPSQRAPLDVEAIKKALEKVSTEEKAANEAKGAEKPATAPEEKAKEITEKATEGVEATEAGKPAIAPQPNNVQEPAGEGGPETVPVVLPMKEATESTGDSAGSG